MLGPPKALADKFFEAACEQGSALQRLLERLAADDTSWYGRASFGKRRAELDSCHHLTTPKKRPRNSGSRS